MFAFIVPNPAYLDQGSDAIHLAVGFRIQGNAEVPNFMIVVGPFLSHEHARPVLLALGWHFLWESEIFLPAGYGAHLNDTEVPLVTPQHPPDTTAIVAQITAQLAPAGLNAPDGEALVEAALKLVLQQMFSGTMSTFKWHHDRP
jgi:hypothetical protein